MEAQRHQVTFQSHPAAKYNNWNLNPDLMDSRSRYLELTQLSGYQYKCEGHIQCLELHSKGAALGGKMGSAAVHLPLSSLMLFSLSEVPVPPTATPSVKLTSQRLPYFTV